MRPRHIGDSEEGFGITEALVAMVILLISLAATVLIIQNNLSSQQNTEAYDSAVQVGYDYLERTRQAEYDELGFHMVDDGWRKEFAWKGKTWKTVTIPNTDTTYNVPPKSSVVQGGVHYDITTDIAEMEDGIGSQKFILVRVTWTREDGTKETLDFETVRSARIDERIPSHMDEYTRIPAGGLPTMPRPIKAGNKVGALNLNTSRGEIIVGERRSVSTSVNGAQDLILTLSCDKGTVNYSHREMRNLSPTLPAPGVAGYSPTKDFTAGTDQLLFEGQYYKTWYFKTDKVPFPSSATQCDLRDGGTTVKLTFVNGNGFSNALARTGYDVTITQEFING